MLLFLKCYLLVLSISTVIGAPYETESSLRAGFGKADITGPIGAIPIQGYLLFSQLANGIHTRLYARACIMGDATNRVVYISADAWGISGFALENAIRIVSNPLYTIKNVMVSATHTHSTPSGTMETFLYSSNALGKVQGQREALQNGIAKAILLAHQNFEEHRAVTATVEVGQVLGASRNRSPQAYIANPETERAKYDADVDRSITTLTFRDETSGIARAVFSWFPVHGTSFSKKYHYVTGDNKGFASYIWEKEEAERGNTEFIAAFGQSNAGDVTPNTSDPTCLDSGLPCDSSSASCPDKYGIPQNGMCVAKGPGGDNENESAKIIGTASARAAQATSAGNGGRKLSGPVQFRHVFVDMSNVEIQFNGGKASTCTPVL
ncbi:Neutral/alkaline nonlysosomal ceramidase, partial [Globomyces pollinis-pini]